MSAHLDERVDAASLVTFRVALGLLLVVIAARFFAHGWIREYYVEPRRFFTYWGLAWVRPWPAPWMYVHYAAIAASGAGLAWSPNARVYRGACVSAFVLFSWAHFSDKTNWLNHYWLVSCVLLVCTCLPWARAGDTVPRWAVVALRAQVGIVYVGGGLAKLGSDWLVHAQPLTIWLGANTDVPLLGPWLGHKSVAYAFSGAGAAFDLGIVPALLWSRTRRIAYVVLVVFHGLTARLFPIGVFPWIMIVLTPIFFAPSWPRKLWRAMPKPALDGAAKYVQDARIARAVLMAWAVLQVLVPLRFLLYPGNVLWHEQGFRFAWKVMVMEKAGRVEFRVVDRATQRVSLVEPRTWLTRIQLKQMATQPDMILELAHWIGDDERQHGRDVAVYADAWVTLNGRPRARLVRPDVDLTAVRDTLAPYDWLEPAPREPPAF